MPTFISEVEIEPFDPRNASASEYAAANVFENCIRAEQWPEDPPRTLDETIRSMRSVPPFVNLNAWAAWAGDQIVASANVVTLKTEENKHLAQYEISVLAPWRRRGIGQQLLRLVADVAGRANRRLLITSTTPTVPAGEACMSRIGAEVGLHSHTNQLVLAELDRDLIRRWQEQAPVPEYELGFWAGPYPEEDLSAIAQMREVMNTAPRDELDVEDFHWTPEHLRQMEASLAQRRVERWTMYVRDRRSRELAGYTEVFWNPDQPETLQQGDTGVLPKFRNHGLGRWLKASMLEKVLRERPPVQRIRTGNANSNAPMLKINQELGFKPYKSWSVWQVELEHVLKYLAK
jgi:GNAT superfamily N-acetyltransferase